jgi:uncharacterized protein (DUF302 family)
MSYYFNKRLENISFEEAIDRVTEELSKEGFGILTNINMQATLKKKLDVDIPRYEILGACNPPFAYKALQEEEKIGLMLPCNVIVHDKDGGIEVSAVDPVVSMQGVGNDSLGDVANEVQAKLKRVIDAI